MKLLDTFFAARPLLFLPLWSIFLVSIHYHHQLAGKTFSTGDLCLLLSHTAAGMFSTYLNQIYDEQSDRLNNKVGFLQKGFLTRNYMWVLCILSLVAALLLSWQFRLLTRTIVYELLALGWIYSAPPLRLKDRPFWGLFANAYGIGFLVPFSVMPELNLHNAGLLGWDNPVYFILAIAAIYLLTTIPDMTGDEATGKETAAVVLGEKAVITLSTIIMLAASGIAVRNGYWLLSGLALMSSLLIVMNQFIKRKWFLLATIKLPIFVLTVLAAFWYPYYGLFVIALIITTRLYYHRRFNIRYPELA